MSLMLEELETFGWMKVEIRPYNEIKIIMKKQLSINKHLKKKKEEQFGRIFKVDDLKCDVFLPVMLSIHLIVTLFFSQSQKTTVGPSQGNRAIRKFDKLILVVAKRIPRENETAHRSQVKNIAHSISFRKIFMGIVSDLGKILHKSIFSYKTQGANFF